MEAVELHLAYMWDCPECGRECFTRGCTPELDADELSGIRDELGVQPWEEGGLMMRPRSVTCGHCGETFIADDGEP